MVTTAMTGPLLNWIQPMVVSAPDAEMTRISIPAFGAGGLSANITAARSSSPREDT